MSTKKPGQIEIYALIDPRDGSIRYVGKSSCAQRRFKQHLGETRRDYPVYRWIAKLRSMGMKPVLRIERVCEQGEWQEVERALIARERDIGARLLNVAEGGDEPYCSTEVRAANGRANARLVHDDPYKKRVWKLKHFMGTHLKSLIKGGDREAEARQRERMRMLAARWPDICAEWVAI